MTKKLITETAFVKISLTEKEKTDAIFQSSITTAINAITKLNDSIQFYENKGYTIKSIDKDRQSFTAEKIYEEEEEK